LQIESFIYEISIWGCIIQICIQFYKRYYSKLLSYSDPIVIRVYFVHPFLLPTPPLNRHFKSVSIQW
jgi:hypothetical protein